MQLKSRQQLRPQPYSSRVASVVASRKSPRASDALLPGSAASPPGISSQGKAWFTVPRVVNEPANRQGQQIYFGIAATVGHDADLACNFDGNPPPAFARPRDTPASLKCVGTFSRACLAALAEHFGGPLRCPLYPQKRTLRGNSWMSALCQKQTFGRPLDSCHVHPSCFEFLDYACGAKRTHAGWRKLSPVTFHTNSLVAFRCGAL